MKPRDGQRRSYLTTETMLVDVAHFVRVDPNGNLVDFPSYSKEYLWTVNFSLWSN